MAKIYIKFNSAVIKEIPLKKEETTFGRKPNNDIAIDNPAISGFHGKIVKEGDQFYVEDLNSTNGTYLNGQRIKKTALKNKDQIGVARHVLEFLANDQEQASPEPASPSVSTPEKSQQTEILRQGMGMPSATPPPAATPPAPSTAIPLPAPTAPRPAPSPNPSFSDVDPSQAPPPDQAIANVKIISGAVNGQVNITIKDLVTYIGTSDKAAIKIKGLMAPALAAAISRRPDGYFLRAVKPGYPKVNGSSVTDQALLENGALIEVGGTNMFFSLSTPPKTS